MLHKKGKTNSDKLDNSIAYMLSYQMEEGALRPVNRIKNRMIGPGETGLRRRRGMRKLSGKRTGP